jgi:hypothetical protein
VVDGNAEEATCIAAGRRRAAAHRRRGSIGESEHEDDLKQYRRLPYLATEAQGRLLDDGRRRRLGSTAAARQRTAALQFF